MSMLGRSIGGHPSSSNQQQNMQYFRSTARYPPNAAVVDFRLGRIGYNCWVNRILLGCISEYEFEEVASLIMILIVFREAIP
jgi:hypothetical protein